MALLTRKRYDEIRADLLNAEIDVEGRISLVDELESDWSESRRFLGEVGEVVEGDDIDSYDYELRPTNPDVAQLTAQEYETRLEQLQADNDRITAENTTLQENIATANSTIETVKREYQERFNGASSTNTTQVDTPVANSGLEQKIEDIYRR